MKIGCFDIEYVVFDKLFSAFQEYDTSHVDLIDDPKPFHDRNYCSKILDCHGTYDTYSSDQDQETWLFAVMFGDEWADEFVYDLLFGLSEKLIMDKKSNKEEQPSKIHIHILQDDYKDNSNLQTYLYSYLIYI